MVGAVGEGPQEPLAEEEVLVGVRLAERVATQLPGLLPSGDERVRVRRERQDEGDVEGLGDASGGHRADVRHAEVHDVHRTHSGQDSADAALGGGTQWPCLGGVDARARERDLDVVVARRRGVVAAVDATGELLHGPPAAGQGDHAVDATRRVERVAQAHEQGGDAAGVTLSRVGQLTVDVRVEEELGDGQSATVPVSRGRSRDLVTVHGFLVRQRRAVGAEPPVLQRVLGQHAREAPSPGEGDERCERLVMRPA